MDHTTDIKIFIAHGQRLYRKGLTTLLASQSKCQVVGDAPVFLGTPQEMSQFAPDILLFDASLIQQSLGDLKFPRHRILFLAQESQLKALVAESAAVVLSTVSAEAMGHAIRRLAGFPLGPVQSSATTRDLRALASSTGTPAAAVPPLTMREHEILQILAGGRTAREVAEELSLSVKTVEAHKLNLMRKLGVHNRAALIRYAVDHSMLPSGLHVR